MTKTDTFTIDPYKGNRIEVTTAGRFVLPDASEENGLSKHYFDSLTELRKDVDRALNMRAREERQAVKHKLRLFDAKTGTYDGEATYLGVRTRGHKDYSRGHVFRFDGKLRNVDYSVRQLRPTTTDADARHLKDLHQAMTTAKNVFEAEVVRLARKIDDRLGYLQYSPTPEQAAESETKTVANMERW